MLEVLRPRIGSGQQDDWYRDEDDDWYRDEDTVAIGEALRLVEHIVGTGSWPADARWVGDR